MAANRQQRKRYTKERSPPLLAYAVPYLRKYVITSHAFAERKTL